MKKLNRLLLLLAFLAVSNLCVSQTFSAMEFINLVYQNQTDLIYALERKGYHYRNTESSDLSKNDIYGGYDGMSVMIIVPSFDNSEKNLAWEFIGADNVYKNLIRDLETNGFNRTQLERRNGGRYVGYTYKRPGLTVVVSSDKTQNSRGIFRFSVRQNSSIKPRVY